MIEASQGGPRHFSGLTRFALKVSAVALAYLILGRISMSLAIPPGFAMAVYPPAGVALGALLVGGYRMVPGVALGSMLLNLWIAQASGHGFSAVGAGLAACIALGAAAQALLSAWLVRRFVGYPTALDTQGAILRFMLLGGPVGCTVNAAAGILALLAFGFLAPDQALSNWATWWIGDTLGVLVCAPVCLILFGQPRDIWRARRRSALLPLLLTLGAVVVAFLFVRQWAQDKVRMDFDERSQRIARAFEARLVHYVDLQKGVESLFVSTPEPSRRQFHAFLANIGGSDPSLQAIEWAPRVPLEERARFEQTIREGGNPGFTITELGPDGAVRVAGTRAEYYPVDFIEPRTGNDRVFGFDLASSPVRRAGIEAARDLAIPVASEPLVLVQESAGGPASLLMSAVYDQRQPSHALEDRRRAITGVVLGVLRPGVVLDAMLDRQDRADIQFRLQDGAVNSKPYLDSIGAARQTIQHRVALPFGGRELVLLAQPTESYLTRQRSWAAWAALVGGSFFTGLLGMYLLLVSGRSFSVENLVQERTRQLHEGERRLRAILDNAANGILTADGDGRIWMSNRAADSLLGREAGGLYGKTIDTLLFVDGQALTLKDLLRSVGVKEVAGRRPDGEEVALELAVAPVEQGQHPLFVLILHDLTERKRADRLKGEFVSAVSHELRTPLTSIRGSLGLLVGGAVGELPPAATKLLAMANDNAVRLGDLINDILDFEKLEYGGMLFKMERRGLLGQVRKTLEINQGYAEKFSIRLELLDGGEDGWEVSVDETRFTQVLTNLLSNAIKFSHEGGTVEVSVSGVGGRARVAVADHGIGISETFRPRIFGKFSQGDASVARRYAGTGLGLSLSKSLIEKMGGGIGFDSVEGQGSTFYIELPLLEPAGP